MAYWQGDLARAVEYLAGDVVRFSGEGGHIRLRSYQEAVARAVVDSVLNGLGLSFAVMFPRQSGKNELQAQIEAYLLARFAVVGGEMVKVSPTWKPQSQNAMARLERALSQNVITEKLWRKEWGYIYRVGKAKITFLSGSPKANIVGATASLMLAVDEAQDVDIVKYDKEIAPMAAAYNATRVFWGTAWTDETLLAREIALIGRTPSPDPPQSAIGEGSKTRQCYVLTADEVRREVPAYGAFVDEQVRRLGRNHPMVRSQFFSETIDAAAQLFSKERQALMQGEHSPEDGPRVGEGPHSSAVYAMLVDVGGGPLPGAATQGRTQISNLGREKDSKGHDATAVTVVAVDTGVSARFGDGGTDQPIYRVVNRYRWVGVGQARLYEEIKALGLHWGAQRIVVDATGLGAGLTSFLDRAFPGRVVGFQFSQGSKSQLGWDFLAIVETGRYREYDPDPTPNPSPNLQFREGSVHVREMWKREGELQAVFWREVRACEGTVLAGPGKVLKWGVPAGRREAASGAAVHDDLLISAALCARLEGENWGRAESEIIEAEDPLEGMWDTY